MPKISVVIPVYNVEKYLKECLDSIINQTLTDIEIICVNDGSTDNSLKILEEYKQKDLRIKVITQENKGLGNARNVGIKYSNADYVYFLDSDDWLDLNCLEKLYNKILKENSDICVLGSYNYMEDSNKIIPSNYYDANRYKLNGDLFFSRFETFLKLYKRSFFEKNNLKFPEGIWFEDVLVSIKSYLLANKISILRENLHYYRIRSSSIMDISKNKPKSFDILEVIDSVEKFLKQNSLYEEYEYNFIKMSLIQMQFHLKRITDKNLKKAFNKKIEEFIEEKNINKIAKQNKQIKGVCQYIRPSFINNIFSISKISEFSESKTLIRILGAKYRIKN